MSVPDWALVQLYDQLEHISESPSVLRWIASLLVVAFLGSLLVIFSRYVIVYPEPLAAWIPSDPFLAIDIAFTLLLLVEVVQLVFGLAGSITTATGKQFEILSLILLRTAFKELSHLDLTHGITWQDLAGPMLDMFWSAGGALGVFILLGIFYRCYQRYEPLVDDATELASFIAAKKLIAFALLMIFGVFLANDALEVLVLGQNATFQFFKSFYTVLIFCDVLLVLLSLRYSTTYAVVFRNSGFAVATMIVRLALSSPPLLAALLAVGAMAFTLALLMAYNRLGMAVCRIDHPEARSDPA